MSDMRKNRGAVGKRAPDLDVSDLNMFLRADIVDGQTNERFRGESALSSALHGISLVAQAKRPVGA
jgi:hypothetical protein